MPRLTKLVVAQLAATGWIDITVKPDMGEVKASKAGHPVNFYLGNLLHEVRRAKRSQRAALIDRFLAGVGRTEDSIPRNYEEARSRLVPILRTAADMGIADLSSARMNDAADPSQQTLRRPWLGDLVLCIACDSPTTLAYTTEGHLEGWGRAFDEVLTDALSNLRAMPEHPGWNEVEPGIWSGDWGDSYESSRILLPDLIHRLGVPDPVAMVPFRNSVLVTSGRNLDGVRRMGELVQRSLENSSRWLSLEPARLDGQVWAPYAPDEAHAELFAGLREQGRAAYYSSQKELLDDLHKARGTDIFVAKYQHMRRGDGPLESYAVWSKGVDTLLPVVDVVVLVQDGAEPVVSGWSDINAAAGSLMGACELVPQRVRLREFPAAASIDALRRLQPANAAQ